MIPHNIWYVSDDGSDDNDCHSESTPCRNIQTVLDRVSDGADIYVTSDTLSPDGYRNKFGFYEIKSPLSYTISPMKKKQVTISCEGTLFNLSVNSYYFPRHQILFISGKLLPTDLRKAQASSFFTLMMECLVFESVSMIYV